MGQSISRLSKYFLKLVFLYLNLKGFIYKYENNTPKQQFVYFVEFMLLNRMFQFVSLTTYGSVAQHAFS